MIAVHDAPHIPLGPDTPHTPAAPGDAAPVLEIPQDVARAGRRLNAGAAAGRMLSWWLGDATSCGPDRAVADAVTAAAPGLPMLARTARAFRRDAVRDALREPDLRQVLDLAAGIPPHDESLHYQVAGTPVTAVFVEQDPVAAYLLLDTASRLPAAVRARTTVVRAGLATPTALLDLLAARTVLDFTTPVLVLSTMALHHLTGFQAVHLLHVLRKRLAPASRLVVTAFVSDPYDAATRAVITAAYTATPPLHLHSAADLRHWLVQTGWHIERSTTAAGLFAAVARLPEAAP